MLGTFPLGSKAELLSLSDDSLTVSSPTSSTRSLSPQLECHQQTQNSAPSSENDPSPPWTNYCLGQLPSQAICSLDVPKYLSLLDPRVRAESIQQPALTNKQTALLTHVTAQLLVSQHAEQSRFRQLNIWHIVQTELQMESHRCEAAAAHTDFHKPIFGKEGKGEREAFKKGTIDSRVFFQEEEEEVPCSPLS